MPPSVGGVKEVTDYIALFDYDINLLVIAIKQTGDAVADERTDDSDRSSTSWPRRLSPASS